MPLLTSPALRQRVFALAGWVTLGLLLALGLPLFVCMPLWTDVHYFGVGAAVLLRGGVLYREVFYVGPPGMFLSQAAVRGLFGWRTEALLLADFILAFASCWLLTTQALAHSRSEGARGGVLCLLLFFYLATTENCHAQPDLWMLLPALAALRLRTSQTGALTHPEIHFWRLTITAFVEGVCWGLGVMFKPFVALPVLACWVLTGIWSVRSGAARRAAIDGVALLGGGLLVGGAVLAWLVISGNWPYFAEYLFGGWAGEYYQYSAGWQRRILRTASSPWPWSLVHLVAVPIALLWVIRSCKFPSTEAGIVSALLGIFYLAWLFQANGLQHQLPYHQASAVILALGVLVRQTVLSPRPGIWRVGLVALVLGAAVGHPLLRPSRMALWGRCWTEGSSASMRDGLALETTTSLVPTHVELEAIADYLRRQGVRDRELTCYNLSTLSLYLELGILPSTRFVQLSEYPTMFPAHQSEILQEVEASPQRFVVWDVAARGITVAEERGPITVSARLADQYRFLREPVVFRTGRYVVHRIRLPTERDASPASTGPVVIPAVR